MKKKKKYCRLYIDVLSLYNQSVLLESVQSDDPFTTEKDFDEWW